MLTYGENIMRIVCADLDAELITFNGEANHVHLRVAYPPALAISVLAQQLKEHAAHTVRREYTGICGRTRVRGHL